ncbi:hypothetical protein NNJEOMEG_00857 [Fundidesulfovibrio magnetotacticus]|uniref:Uncharacterized protein n=1 Tax=Fundidesulfovibrio magnetotacticus TaxID=2730080 RepID=A0A6V8LRR3_9BACT|nr:hypothetical protein [Fundidesulfovibrio magnetotacticus]GFK93028.1 hypothetical protein NNJEOMEG_00857 [Fundidesulfovibrio magnetotacticus]
MSASPTSPAQIPDSLLVNQLIREYAIDKAAQRVAEVDAFINAPTKINLLILEVFKGLVSNRVA